jgi:hypothetical protein
MTTPTARLRSAGHGDLADRLDAVLAVVIDRAVADAEFAEALLGALRGPGAPQGAPQPEGTESLASNVGRQRKDRTTGRSGVSRGSRRRSPGPFDPFLAYQAGETELRRTLATCDLEQLRDIVAEHGMDYDRLALKWKSPDRLIDRIVETVSTRSRKGQAFLNPESGS